MRTRPHGAYSSEDIAPVEEGALTRAAEREAIAVSAAGRLPELEQTIGATLFQRQLA